HGPRTTDNRYFDSVWMIALAQASLFRLLRARNAASEKELRKKGVCLTITLTWRRNTHPADGDEGKRGSCRHQNSSPAPASASSRSWLTLPPAAWDRFTRPATSNWGGRWR